MNKIQQYEIWKKHECGGDWRILKDGTEGNNYEFECDTCGKGLSVMSMDSLSQEDREDLQKLSKRIEERKHKKEVQKERSKDREVKDEPKVVEKTEEKKKKDFVKNIETAMKQIKDGKGLTKEEVFNKKEKKEVKKKILTSNTTGVSTY